MSHNLGCQNSHFGRNVPNWRCDTYAVPNCYDPKQAAAVPYYASCPLFPEDFQRIDVHGVEVYSTNFN
eukprot:scaffold23057_cov146-Skeletonema_marinoi.AAC.1